MYPPLFLQLSHGCIDPGVTCPPVLPQSEEMIVFLPGQLETNVVVVAVKVGHLEKLNNKIEA